MTHFHFTPHLYFQCISFLRIFDFIYKVKYFIPGLYIYPPFIHLIPGLSTLSQVYPPYPKFIYFILGLSTLSQVYILYPRFIHLIPRLSTLPQVYILYPAFIHQEAMARLSADMKTRFTALFRILLDYVAEMFCVKRGDESRVKLMFAAFPTSVCSLSSSGYLVDY